MSTNKLFIEFDDIGALVRVVVEHKTDSGQTLPYMHSAGPELDANGRPTGRVPVDVVPAAVNATVAWALERVGLAKAEQLERTIKEIGGVHADDVAAVVAAVTSARAGRTPPGRT